MTNRRLNSLFAEVPSVPQARTWVGLSSPAVAALGLEFFGLESQLCLCWAWSPIFAVLGMGWTFELNPSFGGAGYLWLLAGWYFPSLNRCEIKNFLHEINIKTKVATSLNKQAGKMPCNCVLSMSPFTWYMLYTAFWHPRDIIHARLQHILESF